MQRYFVEDKINNNFILRDTDIHHIKNVMRCKINDKIEIVYDEKVYVCNIDSIEPLLLSIVKVLEEDRALSINLSVAVPLVQEQKFDLIIQKLTELGVSEIIPVKMERSIVKLDNKKEEKKLLRWNSICKEASEQCKRVSIPNVANIISLKELGLYKRELKLICSLNDDTKDIGYYLNENIKDILFVVGPEGGFTNEEENYLIKNGFNSVSLGKRVLRLETAIIYVASIVNYIYRG